ncbi:hypothetical protein [Haloplanus natans]|uniref:hypothetical protein n=1 Tax=Haloplanus natans TaxID=376171 RepID=UPI0012FB47ED|nr:hypothetical protein [Haloplanus natans]
MSSVPESLWREAWPLGAATVPIFEGTAAALVSSAAGLVACGAFVHLSGGLVARRDMAGGQPVSPTTLARAVRAAIHLLASPLLVGAWSLAVAAGALVLAPDLDAVATALAALAIAVAVRAAAYYSEDFSRTLATMLPFSLLGLAVLDGVVTRSPATAADVVVRLLAHWPVAVYGPSALLLVEAILGTIDVVRRR